jgi:polar amino acid transport system substrate-binding protein
VKQVVQSNRTGELKVAEVPAPPVAPGHILVQTAFSAVSLGTEGKKVTMARQSLLGKAWARPDLVRQVVRTAQREGLLNTYRKVMNRLDEPMSLGYSAAGVVIAVGAGVEEFRVGDRVACGGEGAAHAEVLAVPVNLCARVPDGACLEHAAFTTIGAIALQGLRQADVTLGERVAVIGLGLVGQLAVQLLKANGCRVLGVDLDPVKVATAVKMGADLALVRSDPNMEAAVSVFSQGLGVDAVLITAATSSNDPVELAVQMCRDRGRIVVVGGVKLDVPRDACYYKELEVKLSRSYGPGRYDPSYEENGVDYPIGYVRWTEQRNMQAFLDLLAVGKVNLADLITHRFPFAQAEQAYAMFSAEHREGPAPLGILFEYDTAKDYLSPSAQKVYTANRPLASSHRSSAIGIGFIGAGSFARKFLIPPLVKHPHARLVGVATATGISGQSAAQKFGFSYSTGDYRQILNDPEIQAVFIATRHNLHAPLAAEALRAGKSVFVEKPLALTREQLDDVVAAYEQSVISNPAARDADSRQSTMLMVGFNRRFAPLTQEMHRFFEGHAEPMVIHCRVNAGFVESKHWVHNPEDGGGRLLGEACHFIDLIAGLVGAPIQNVYTAGMANGGRYHDDNVSITLAFADGSVGNILYLANGDPLLPKERVEVFCQGATAALDDFCRLVLYRDGQRTVKKSVQDKGHRAEVQAFVVAVRGAAESPVPFAEYVMSTRATLAAVESLRQGRSVAVGTL